MFRLTRQQHRRWTLPLLVVFLLHWCIGLSEATASVICLEPGNTAAVELVTGFYGDDSDASQQNIPCCVDLPTGDSHPGHTASAGTDAKVSVASLPALALFYLLPAPTPIVASYVALTSPAPNHPAVLRESTVLRI